MAHISYEASILMIWSPRSTALRLHSGRLRGEPILGVGPQSLNYKPASVNDYKRRREFREKGGLRTYSISKRTRVHLKSPLRIYFSYHILRFRRVYQPPLRARVRGAVWVIAVHAPSERAIVSPRRPHMVHHKAVGTGLRGYYAIFGKTVF